MGTAGEKVLAADSEALGATMELYSVPTRLKTKFCRGRRGRWE